MKTTFFTKYANVEKVTIELDREQFVLVKVAVATLLEKYEEISNGEYKESSTFEDIQESYKDLKVIEKSLHNLNFVEYKGGD